MVIINVYYITTSKGDVIIYYMLIENCKRVAMEI